jgi:hypothetical protein
MTTHNGEITTNQTRKKTGGNSPLACLLKSYFNAKHKHLRKYHYRRLFPGAGPLAADTADAARGTGALAAPRGF